MKRILIHFLQVLGGSRGESADLIGIAGKAGPRFLKTSSSEVVPLCPGTGQGKSGWASSCLGFCSCEGRALQPVFR